MLLLGRVSRREIFFAHKVYKVYKFSITKGLNMKPLSRKTIFFSFISLALLLSLYGAAFGPQGQEVYGGMNIFAFILIGFAAQMIDGALGMAYGVSSNTFLLSLGLPPASASASVHAAEVFTTGASGFSHWRLKNIDMTLAKRLIIPGVLGGVTGAYILTSLDGDLVKPWISAYLMIMGIVILVKAFQHIQPADKPIRHVGILGLIGGFFDAIGGGGWGPVVTTTLVARGNLPRFTIGTVNFVEFFVTLAQSITFLIALNFSDYWQVILGLLVGGVLAAPIAALVARRLPAKALMVLVGITIILLSIRTIALTIWG
jgi:uncharacterized protein